MVCSPCGHKIVCSDCVKNIKNCPICRSTIQKAVTDYDSSSCLVCLHSSNDTILLPCGHRNVCYQCALHVWNEGKQCPECREKSISFRHMFNLN